MASRRSSRSDRRSCSIPYVIISISVVILLMVYFSETRTRSLKRMVQKPILHNLRNGHGGLSLNHLALSMSLGDKNLRQIDSESGNITVQPYATTTTPSAALGLKYPIWWAAPFSSTSGYGAEAVSYITGLWMYDLIREEDLWLTQSGGAANALNMPDQVSNLLYKLNYRQQKKVLSRQALKRCPVIVCHSFPDFWLTPSESKYPEAPGSPCPTPEMLKMGKVYKVGRTMFETDGLQDHLVNHIKQFDEVWVPTEFNRDTFSSAGISKDKIYVLPESINLDDFDPNRLQPLRISGLKGTQVAVGNEGGEEPNFVFLSVFKWEGRKGWELLLKAFLEEFKASEKVELHIVTHPFMERVYSWKDKVREGIQKRCNLDPGLQDFDKMPRILITSSFIPDDTFPKLYKGADAWVLPTRGEGWGRPQMEAMAMELPVISTNWSGLTAFLNEQTGYPIAVDKLVEAKPDGPSFFAYFTGTKWAEPSVTHLRKLMRQVVDNRAEGKAKGKAARQYLKDHFSPEAVAKTLHKLILDVQDRAAANGL
ncbi:hypothetical protein CEUSTIGMA_g2783.t1 [Chlamydomonas eustigma]|uniref:Glycosyl transferase family 1 domain-containing protein n=1 Tax=Chlamydomonas eustigma TaxID=1157962 RepID=A0A250WWW2_9CHLO|nr:hypothetical protein CEUSTIGMA_g2783.t1 [Chlamydomonas eustigma]|eukprot:GAX75338.1 hypothetical protein CEUSTIGMA_g2783.t1 [Chlamydomonas eustigma]